MAVRCWSVKTGAVWRLWRSGAFYTPGAATQRCGLFSLALAAFLLPSMVHAQAHPATARQQIDASVQALGGPAYCGVHTIVRQGRIAGFFQGQPTGALTRAVVSLQLPDRKHIALGPKGAVVQIFRTGAAWEITYKGVKPLPAKTVAAYDRGRQYALRTVLCQWAADRASILLDQGPRTVDGHLAEAVTVISRKNLSATLVLKAASHLPLQLTYRWRDPDFHDQNTDTVIYANYHQIAGIATPFTLTERHNGQTISQFFVDRVQYNRPLAPTLFDPALAKRP
jgi:hypothetical protein